MTTFRVLEPEDWGMRWARPPVAEKLDDPETYIHHRAGNGRHDIPAEQAFYEMNEGAIANKDYSATDYDILVHEHFPSDMVTIGIARGQWMSAATRDRNETGEAICALGYFHPGHSLSEHPSPGMVEGLARAVVLSIERGWSARDTTILGHRDNPAHPGATGCPGDYLYSQMPTIRARVAELLADPTPPPGDDMTALAVPERAYDSRPSEQGDVNPALAVANTAVPKTRFKANETRAIVVGFSTQAAVNITAVGSGPGFVSVSGTSTRSKASAVNLDADQVAANCVPVATPAGKVYITATAPCDIIVDVFARG